MYATLIFVGILFVVSNALPLAQPAPNPAAKPDPQLVKTFFAAEVYPPPNYNMMQMMNGMNGMMWDEQDDEAAPMMMWQSRGGGGGGVGMQMKKKHKVKVYEFWL